MKSASISKPDDIIVTIAIWLTAITAVVMSPVSGFFWNLVIFIGALEITSFLLYFIIAFIYNALNK